MAGTTQYTDEMLQLPRKELTRLTKKPLAKRISENQWPNDNINDTVSNYQVNTHN